MTTIELNTNGVTIVTGTLTECYPNLDAAIAYYHALIAAEGTCNGHLDVMDALVKARRR